MTFKPGDIFRLRSGGPAMTVWEVEPGHEGERNPIAVFGCEWFDNNILRRNRFSEVEVEPVAQDNLIVAARILGDCGKVHSSIKEWQKCTACDAELQKRLRGLKP